MGYLSDVTRRRIAALLLIVAVVVGALAIADTGPFSDPPTEEEKAQAAVEDFFAAAREKDFRGMCALLTPATRVRILQRTAALLGGGEEAKRCQDALAAQEELLSEEVGETLSGTRITAVKDSRVSGNRAAVDIELTFPQAKRPVPRTFQLELVGDEWRIASSIL